jgi:hypothetical protein
VAARYIGTEQPAKYQLSDKSMSARAAAQIIKDECLLDGNPTMNLASFVTTWSGHSSSCSDGESNQATEISSVDVVLTIAPLCSYVQDGGRR